MKIFAATDKFDGLGTRFYFHAENQKAADSKMFRWNRYHGSSDSPGWGWHEAVEVKAEDVPNESWVHDEWVDWLTETADADAVASADAEEERAALA